MRFTRLIIIVVIVLVALIITGFISREIFQKVVQNITEREVARITQGVTESERERITQKITETEIAQRTNQMVSTATRLQEVDCGKPTLKLSPDAYTGPLFDDHIHMPFTFDVPQAIYAQADWNAPILEKDITASQIICVLNNSKTSAAFGFYVVPNLLKGSALQQLKAVDTKYRGRIYPFLMPTHVSGLDLKPQEYEEIITSNNGLFKGVGEFAFYKGSLKGIAPDDPAFMELYAIAGKHDLIVMIHPDQGQLQAIERVLRGNPTVSFLFHGQEIASSIEEIMANYPNAYYSVDTQLMDFHDHRTGNLYGTKNKEEFRDEVSRNFDKILAVNVASWKPLIEKYPDRFLWGTDRAFAWHFDEEVGATIEEMTRMFIGKLDPAVQEKFAYQNAQRLVQKK